MSFNSFFVGWTTTVRPDFEKYVPEPVVPSNYKDPKTISDYIAKAKDKNILMAALKPVTAVIQSAVVLDHDAKPVFNSAAHGGPAGAALLQFLVHTFDFNQTLTSDARRGRYLFGFGIKNMLRIAGLECLGAHVPVPPRSWYHNPYALDPVDVLLGSVEERERIGVPLLCQFLGLPYTDSDLNEVDKQALMVRDLVLRADLLAYS